MSEEEILDALDKIGYSGNKLDLMRIYLSEYIRRKSVFSSSPITMEDIATASLIFDGFNKITERVKEVK